MLLKLHVVKLKIIIMRQELKLKELRKEFKILTKIAVEMEHLKIIFLSQSEGNNIVNNWNKF